MKTSLFTIIFLALVSVVSAQTVKPSFSVTASYYNEAGQKYSSKATLTYNNTEASMNNISKLFVNKTSSPNSIDTYFYDSKGYYQGQVVTDLNGESYLGVDLGKEVEVTLTFADLQNFENGVYLEDKVENVTYDLSKTQEVTVDLTSGKNKNRFVITFGTEEDDNDGKDDGVDTEKPSISVTSSYYTEAGQKYGSKATLTYNNTEASINNISKLFVNKTSSPNSIDAYFYDSKGYYQGQVVTDLNGEVYLGVDLGKEVEATLTFVGVEAFKYGVYLEDKVEGVIYDLLETQEVTVDLTSGKNKNRFVITFGTKAKDNEGTNDGDDDTEIENPGDNYDNGNDDNGDDNTDNGNNDNGADDNDGDNDTDNNDNDTNIDINDDSEVTTGLNDIKEENAFTVYSSNKTITIVSSESSMISEIAIININGQVVKMTSAYDNYTTINMNAYPAGVYIVKAKVGSEVNTSKVVVR